MSSKLAFNRVLLNNTTSNTNNQSQELANYLLASEENQHQQHQQKLAMMNSSANGPAGSLVNGNGLSMNNLGVNVYQASLMAPASGNGHQIGVDPTASSYYRAAAAAAAMAAANQMHHPNTGAHHHGGTGKSIVSFTETYFWY
jgi:hypothetical protein